MPFKKLENCNQVVSIGKDLNLSLVNIAGNDIAQGNKKLIIGKTAHLRKSCTKVYYDSDPCFHSKNYTVHGSSIGFRYFQMQSSFFLLK